MPHLEWQTNRNNVPLKADYILAGAAIGSNKYAYILKNEYPISFDMLANLSTQHRRSQLFSVNIPNILLFI